MRRIALVCVACLAVPFFFDYLTDDTIFGGKCFENKMCFDSLYNLRLKYFSL